MILLRLISWQYVRKHVLRTLLTLAGIVLGVAVFVGMHTANQSVLYAFQRTIDRIAGATQLQVSAGETGFEESVLERVQDTPGVRVAVPVIEAVVQTGFEGQGNLLVLGVDMLGDRSLRSYDLEGEEEGAIDDPLVFLALLDSLILTKTFARRNNLDTNSKIELSTVAGPMTFTVRGLMESGGLASAFGGSLAIMDVYAAQKMFGRGQRFDRIDLAVNDGVDIQQVQERLAAKLGPGFQIETPSSRGQQYESIAAIYRITANITSLFALFIGMFIIYNTFAIAVMQRRAEIGTLRALGATQGQIRALFLMESAAAGLIASVIGIGAGTLIARGMAAYIGDFFGDVYGMTERAQQVSANPWLIAAALAIGICASVVAAFVPARNAARIDPVKALQKGRYQSLSEGESRIRRRLAMGCAAIALACILAGQHGVLLYIAYGLTVLAALFITPAAGVRLAMLLRPLLKRVRPVEGTLAADSLIQAPRRTSGTLAALMLSIGLVVGLAGMARASYGSITQWVGTALNPDLFVTATEKLTERSYRLPASVGGELRAIPEIEAVQPVRIARIPVRGRPVVLTAVDIAGLRDRARLPAVEGNSDEMYRVTARGEGVILSDNLATKEGLHAGDIIEIPTPGGLLRLPVAGTAIEYSDQQGSILIDRELYIRHWNDDTVNAFRVYLKPGAGDEEVRRTILKTVGSHTRIFVLTNRELRDFIMRVTDQWFALSYVQIAVAILVAVLGIVNTLTVSITDRRRELGVLQAVGALRRQIRHTVWIESLAIGALGAALGLGLGALQLYYSLEISRRDIAGIRLNYEYPVETAAALLPIILIAAFAAALGPAESAVRGSLVEALEYE